MLLTNSNQISRSSQNGDWLIEEAEKLSIALAMARAIEQQARDRLKVMNLSNDEYLALWSMLDATERAALKRRK
jgi:hypothetical protein